tara:strand:+ start:229 stop:1062 length:834 start_codon:yes stop_codon:yes gene_type:complete
MSTLNNYTTATRPTHSIGLCIFNTTSKAIEVSDGTNWQIYNKDSTIYPQLLNRYGIILDGTNDYLDIGVNGDIAELSSASAISVALWVKIHSGSNDMILASGTSASDRFMPFLNASRKIEVYMGSGSVLTSTTALSFNTWYHVAIFKDGTNASIWIDGIQEDTSTTAPSTLSTNAGKNLKVGSTQIFGGYYTDGEFDEVAIWGSDQSSNISSIYTGTTPANISALNPDHWWRMGDTDLGTGTTVTDEGVGSSLVDGILTNGAAFQDLSTAPDSIYIA